MYECAVLNFQKRNCSYYEINSLIISIWYLFYDSIYSFIYPVPYEYWTHAYKSVTCTNQLLLFLFIPKSSISYKDGIYNIQNDLTNGLWRYILSFCTYCRRRQYVLIFHIFLGENDRSMFQLTTPISRDRKWFLLKYFTSL